MTKSEFIAFLRDKAEERGIYQSHWKETSMSGDFWHLYKPFVDWVEDSMCLYHDGCVKIEYNKTLYGNTTKKFETTYEDFIKNYDKSLG